MKLWDDIKEFIGSLLEDDNDYIEHLQDNGAKQNNK